MRQFTLAIAVFYAASTAAVASPVIYCSSLAEGNYEGINKYIRGLHIYRTYENPWAHNSFGEALLLTHCASKSMLRVEPMGKKPSLNWAHERLVEMIADDKDQTFGEVADRLRSYNFRVERDSVKDDGCLCMENL